MTEVSAKETTTEPAEKPVPRIVSGLTREKTYTLVWPVEFDGVVYTDIRIHRCSAAEIDAWVDAVARGDRVTPPVIDIPVEVWDAMDADDQTDLDQAAMDFMPRRLKVAAGFAQQIAGPSSESSATPSADGTPLKS